MGNETKACVHHLLEPKLGKSKLDGFLDKEGQSLSHAGGKVAGAYIADTFGMEGTAKRAMQSAVGEVAVGLFVFADSEITGLSTQDCQHEAMEAMAQSALGDATDMMFDA